MTTFKLNDKYKSNSEKWGAIDDFTAGQLPVVASPNYLKQMKIEQGDGAWHFLRRQECLDYENHCKKGQEKHLSALFQDISYSEDIENSDIWMDWLDDVDGRGKTFKKFYRCLLVDFLKHGSIGALIQTSADDTVQTAADEQAKGVRAYLVKFPATSILDWKHYESGPRRGQLEKLLLLIEPYYNEHGEHVQVCEYTMNQTSFSWTKYVSQKVQGATSDFEKREFKVLDLGEVSGVERIPFVMMGDGCDTSPLAEVQTLSQQWMNKKSQLDNIMYFQAFQRVLICGVKKDDQKLVTESTWAFLKDPNAKVEVIEAANPEALERDCMKLEKRIIEASDKKYIQVSDTTKQVQSAETLAKQDAPLIEFYEYVIGEFNDFLTDILVMVQEMDTRLTVEDISVSLSEDFQGEDSQKVIDQIVIALSQARLYGAKKMEEALTIKLVELTLDVDDETKGEIIDEIKSQAGIDVNTNIDNLRLVDNAA